MLAAQRGVGEGSLSRLPPSTIFISILLSKVVYYQ